MNSQPPVTNDGGFWRLDHDGLAAILARRDLSWGLARVYLASADLTLGYGREQDTLSLSQIAERAGMYSVKPDGSKQPDCPHVARALKELSKRGLYGCTKGKGQSVVRWAIWPAPPMPDEATAGVGNPATAGSGTTAELGNETTAKATAEAGRHQDTKNPRRRKKKSTANKPPPDSRVKKVENLPLPPPLDCPTFREIWARWIEYRKEIRHVLTVSTAEAQLHKLAQAGAEVAGKIIEQSVEQGWQGLFPLKELPTRGTFMPATGAISKTDGDFPAGERIET
jgi:hypothetical protein